MNSFGIDIRGLIIVVSSRKPCAFRSKATSMLSYCERLKGFDSVS